MPPGACSLLNLIIGINKQKIGDSFMANSAEVFVRGHFPVQNHVKPKAFKERIVKCGDVYEVYDYESPIFTGFESRGGRNYSSSTSDEVKDENRDKTLKRTRKDIRNIINCNFGKYGEKSKFLTLTFSENIENLEDANKYLKKFIMRLNYRLGISVKYTCVPEIQWERFDKYGVKVWHFHIVLYNLPFVPQKDLMELWGHGFVFINAIDNVDNVGAYICKYITKESAFELVGKKSVSNSRGLYKPVEITDKKEVSKVLAHLETSQEFKLKYQNTFTNDYTGDTVYSQYVRK